MKNKRFLLRGIGFLIFLSSLATGCKKEDSPATDTGYYIRFKADNIQVGPALSG